VREGRVSLLASRSPVGRGGGARTANWNESSTVKYQQNTLGEFQIHKKRDCVKFRFNIINLLKIINKELLYNIQMKREKDPIIFKVNYIGSKKLLLSELKPIFDKYLENSKSFADLFCGTGIVSDFVNREYPNISSIFLNDLNEYASAISLSRIQQLDEKEIQLINNHIDILNSCRQEGFFFKNYSDKYFTGDNCKIIDGMNFYIDKLDNIKIKTFLKSVLICSADSVANTSCVYGAYLKKIKKTAQTSLQLPKIKQWTNRKNVEINVNTGDILDYIKDKDFDVVYLDPPYNSRQYGSNYHILETMYKNDNPIISGKTGLRPYYKSSFCNKEVENTFLKLIRDLKCNTIIMSYSNDGLLSKDKIKEILDTKYHTEIYEIKYKRFKSNSNTDQKDIVEYVFCGRSIKESREKRLYTKDSLKNMTLTSLKNIARQLKIKKYSTFKLADKEILIELISLEEK
jgi:adenine-specific DNA-methyltransferase